MRLVNSLKNLFKAASLLSQDDESTVVRLELALEASGLVDWDFDYEKNTAYRSLRHDQLYGYSELLPKWNFDDFYKHVLPEYHLMISKKFEELPHTGKLDFEFRIQRVDGEIRWIHLTGKSQKDASGKIKRVAGILKDITEEKENKVQLSLHNQNLEALFQKAPEFFCVISGPDLVYEYVNPAHVELFGGINMTGLSVVKDQKEIDPAFIDTLHRIIKTGESLLYKETPAQIGSRLRYLDMIYAPRKNATGKVDGVYALGADVTVQVNSVIARDNFMGIASHELKTPITALKLQTQMYQKVLELEGIEAFNRQRLTKIFSTTDKQVNRLARLVDDMLDITRIKADKLEMKLKRVNFSKLVLEAFENFYPQFKSVGINLNLNVASDVELVVDETRIEQVLTNLITNVIKYAPNSPLDVVLEHQDRNATLIVRDHGRGIETKNFDKIFERFERVDQGRNISGMGIGLYISKKIVLAHQGKLYVDSQVGKGSTFTLELPLT